MPLVRHFTLTAGTARKVTLTDNSSGFEVLNRNGAGEIFVSHDGSDNPPPPVVNGDDFDVVVAGVGASLTVQRIGTRKVTVSLISPQATTASVRGIP